MLAPTLPNYVPVPGTCLHFNSQLEPKAKFKLDVEVPDLIGDSNPVPEEGPIQTGDVAEGNPKTVRDLMATAANATENEAINLWSVEDYSSAGTRPEKSILIRDGLKVEVPLMPSPRSSVQKKEKTVTFEDLLEHYVDYAKEVNTTEDTQSEEESINHSLKKLLEHSQKEVYDEIMKEPIGVNDKTLRPQIPTLEPVVVQHPRSKQRAEELLAIYFDQAKIKSLPSEDQEERALNWIPIPRRLTQADLGERIEASDVLTRVETRPDDITRNQQLLWKEPGFRVLNGDDYQDEELKPDGDLTAGACLRAKPDIPQKRPLEVELLEARTAKQQKQGLPSVFEKMTATAARHRGLKPLISRQVQLNFAEPILDPRLRRRLDRASYGSNFGGYVPVIAPSSGDVSASDSLIKRFAGQSTNPFSATGSLSSFLDLRGSRFKKPAPADLPLNGRPEVPSDSIQASQMTTPVRDKEDFEQVEVPSTPKHIFTPHLQPCPALEWLREPRTIVADENLVGNLAILKMLDQHVDSLTTIYRELKGQPDILLNPVTAVIYTNIQALTQRSLPGQTLGSGEVFLHSRIRALVPEFESVFVLATISPSLCGLALESQSSSIASFASFCASFEGSEEHGQVCPIWVSIEDGINDQRKPDPLCAWTWTLICRYAFRGSSSTNRDRFGRSLPLQALSFIQDVTVWERFLCKCGMNVMAAQVVLGMLKKPESAGQTLAESEAVAGLVSGEKLFGLGQFVSMSGEERNKMFAEPVGRKCLERVNRLLDARWSE